LNKQKRKLTVYLGDLAYTNENIFFETRNPLGIGYIATYAKLRFSSDINVKLFKDPSKLVDACILEVPDIIALSFYAWNTNLNKCIVEYIKKQISKDIYIVWGGPSIDTDINEQKRIFKKYPEVDFLIENEGEIGFGNLLESFLSNRNLFQEEIDGVSFLKDNEIIKGLPIGLSTDLSLLESPYLNGMMDPFIDDGYQPCIQTSRLCPYTCAFCVSGKNRGKLRVFELDMVREEINYIAKKYVDKPNMTLYLTDENFGVLDRDVEVASMIKNASEKYKYPKNVFFYNDKRFTERSREIVAMLGPMTHYGMVLALQSENPDALIAANRRNITSEQIDDNIEWATSKKIDATTELIFGLPGETAESFKNLLDKSVKRGFDSVLCNNLYLVDGIEMNRGSYREKHNLGTHHRIVSDNAGKITLRDKNNKSHDLYSAEVQEIVTSSDTFNFNEYIEIRLISFFYYAVFTLRFQRIFFQFLNKLDISLSKFALDFLQPDDNKSLLKDHKRFIEEINLAIRNELFETDDQVTSHFKDLYQNEEPDNPHLINLYFGTKLIYESNSWLKETLNNYFENILMENNIENGNEIAEIGKFLIELSDRMRINLFDDRIPSPIETTFDIPKWVTSKFKKSIFEYKTDKKYLQFEPDSRYLPSIKALRKQVSMEKKLLFCYQAVESLPRSILVYDLKIKNG